MSYIDQILGPGGLLAQQIQGWEVRDGQLTLAKVTDQAMCEGGTAIVEGPTGVGKSFAYLVPAIGHAACNNKRTVVATANIALQEQLAYKDLPELQRLLPFKFTYGLLKGRNNYICPEKVIQSHADNKIARLTLDERKQYR